MISSITNTLNNYYNNTKEFFNQTGQTMSNYWRGTTGPTGGRRTRRKNYGGMSSIHGAKITGIHTAKASYVGGKKRRHKRSRHHARK